MLRSAVRKWPRARIGRMSSSTACSGSCSGCHSSNVNPTAEFKPAHAIETGQPLVQTTVHGDYCSTCGMVGHAAHACTNVTTEAGVTRLGNTLDWEVIAHAPRLRTLHDHLDFALPPRASSTLTRAARSLMLGSTGRAPRRGLSRTLLLRSQRASEILPALLARSCQRQVTLVAAAPCWTCCA